MLQAFKHTLLCASRFTAAVSTRTTHRVVWLSVVHIILNRCYSIYERRGKKTWEKQIFFFFFLQIPDIFKVKAFCVSVPVNVWLNTPTLEGRIFLIHFQKLSFKYSWLIDAYWGMKWSSLAREHTRTRARTHKRTHARIPAPERTGGKKAESKSDTDRKCSNTDISPSSETSLLSRSPWYFWCRSTFLCDIWCVCGVRIYMQREREICLWWGHHEIAYSLLIHAVCMGQFLRDKTRQREMERLREEYRALREQRTLTQVHFTARNRLLRVSDHYLRTILKLLTTAFTIAREVTPTSCQIPWISRLWYVQNVYNLL